MKKYQFADSFLINEAELKVNLITIKIFKKRRDVYEEIYR
jgi:hypothetical protein